MPSPARSRAPVRLTAAVLAVGALAACQPVEGPAAQRGEDDAVETVSAPPARGAPVTSTRMPADLGALLDGFSTTATQWQDDPVPVEITAELRDGTWVAASVRYLAPDADRFLLVTADAEGDGQQRPTLEALGLTAIPRAGLAEVPPLPAGILAPEALAEAAADARDTCGLRDVEAVVYSTGAPAAWDGTRWTNAPAWSAILTEDADGGGDGVTVDAVSGAALPDGCLDG